MAAFESLAPLVRRRVAGAPDFVIVDALRVSAREFCRLSWFARRRIEVPLVAGQPDYFVRVENYTQEEVIGIVTVTHRGRSLCPSPPDAYSRTGNPSAFAFMPPETLQVIPVPGAESASPSEPLVVVAVIQPADDASDLGADLSMEWDQGIADGAISRLCDDEGAAWSSPRLAEIHRSRFHAAAMQAKGKGLRWNTPGGGLQVSGRGFIGGRSFP